MNPDPVISKAAFSIYYAVSAKLKDLTWEKTEVCFGFKLKSCTI